MPKPKTNRPKAATLVKTFGTAKKVFVGGVSVASVGLAGYLMYTLHKNRTRIRLMVFVRMIYTHPALFAGGPNEKATAIAKAMDSLLMEINEFYKQAKEKSPELTVDDFNTNILRLTQNETEQFTTAMDIMDKYLRRNNIEFVPK